jgi:putative ABC transport system ATP-binding protein
MSTQKELLRISHVSKKYTMGDDSFYALRDVSLSIFDGEYVAIMGPSGSGKSTLMHSIGCLDHPTEGNVFIDGIDVSTMKETDLAKVRNMKIGFVFQQFNLLRKTSAISNVELPLLYAGVPAKERTARAIEMLTEVGLGSKLQNYPSQLSGGQQQRVAIARALVTNPSILLADEPTGNLDSKSGSEVLSLFDTLHQKGKTIILVTHDESVATHARRIVRITDGAIVKDYKNPIRKK